MKASPGPVDWWGRLRASGITRLLRTPDARLVLGRTVWRRHGLGAVFFEGILAVGPCFAEDNREYFEVIRPLEALGFGASGTSAQMSPYSERGLGSGPHSGPSNTAEANQRLRDALPYLLQIRNLRSFDFRDTRITDLSPISRLRTLVKLDLRNTPVVDITPLHYLDLMEELDLAGTQVRNVAPLAGLIRLAQLNLNDTQVSDLAPLARLTWLRSLSFGRTRVIDLKPLARLTSLEVVYLDRTQVEDIGPLAGLPALVRLAFGWSKVTPAGFAAFCAERGRRGLSVLPDCRDRR